MEAQNLDFDLVRTIQVIDMDGDLKAMFNKKFPDETVDMVLEAAKSGILDKKAESYVESIFTNIIATKANLTELYSRNIAKSTKSKTETKATVDKPSKKEKVKLPKEYNKIRIEADIKANGGIATEFHKAMLALNDMKNVRGRLNGKGNRQRYADGKPFTDAECREIIAVVQIVKNRLDKIR